MDKNTFIALYNQGAQNSPHFMMTSIKIEGYKHPEVICTEYPDYIRSFNNFLEIFDENMEYSGSKIIDLYFIK